MKATEVKYQLLVTVETTLVDSYVNFESHVLEVEKRIKEQIAGHRTEKRLAEHCNVMFYKMVWSNNRELPD